MFVVRTHRIEIYVDRVSQQWVVRDSEGEFWVLPNVENPWEKRQRYVPNPEQDLEPIPGHYKYILGLPTSGKAGTS